MGTLELTDKAKRQYPGVTLEAFRSVGWTDEALKEHGLAGVVVEPTITAISGHGEWNRKSLPPGTAVDNVFGLKDLAEITLLFREFASPRTTPYPGGWSYEQQILYVADALAKRYLRT